MNRRLRCVRLASGLPFWVLELLICVAPVWIDDGWPLWLDAHYYRYCRFDVALWGHARS